MQRGWVSGDGVRAAWRRRGGGVEARQRWGDVGAIGRGSGVKAAWGQKGVACGWRESELLLCGGGIGAVGGGVGAA